MRKITKVIPLFLLAVPVLGGCSGIKKLKAPKNAQRFNTEEECFGAMMTTLDLQSIGREDSKLGSCVLEVKGAGKTTTELTRKKKTILKTVVTGKSSFDYKYDSKRELVRIHEEDQTKTKTSSLEGHGKSRSSTSTEKGYEKYAVGDLFGFGSFDYKNKSYSFARPVDTEETTFARALDDSAKDDILDFLEGFVDTDGLDEKYLSFFRKKDTFYISYNKTEYITSEETGGKMTGSMKTIMESYVTLVEGKWEGGMYTCDEMEITYLDNMKTSTGECHKDDVVKSTDEYYSTLKANKKNVKLKAAKRNKFVDTTIKLK